MFKLMIVGCLIYSIVVLLPKCESAPYQFLPMREGYVPVYIRLGDTPLNEINPELAIAFHEVGPNARQIKSDDSFAVPSSTNNEKNPRLEQISSELDKEKTIDTKIAAKAQ